MHSILNCSLKLCFSSNKYGTYCGSVLYVMYCTSTEMRPL